MTTLTHLPTLRDLGISIGPVTVSSYGSFEVVVTFDDGLTPSWDRVYSTNPSGSGLWSGDTQVQGTMQFHASSAAAFRRALAAHLRSGGR